MYCPKCGTQNPDEAAFCSNCGEKLVMNSNTGFQGNNQNNIPSNPQNPQNPQGGFNQNFQGGFNNNGQQGGYNQNNFQGGYNPNNFQGGYNQPPQDGSVGAMGILFFCIPLAGAIAYFVYNNKQQTNKAKQACYCALGGFGLGIIINIIVAIASAS